MLSPLQTLTPHGYCATFFSQQTALTLKTGQPWDTSCLAFRIKHPALIEPNRTLEHEFVKVPKMVVIITQKTKYYIYVYPSTIFLRSQPAEKEKSLDPAEPRSFTIYRHHHHLSPSHITAKVSPQILDNLQIIFRFRPHR